MSDVTRILSAIEQGEPQAAEKLLPLVYEELRRLAAQKMAQESPDHSLQATAFVHEAYIRLVEAEQQQCWESRRHFFAAAAEAMRRILVESARRKRRAKHGGDVSRVELVDGHLAVDTPPEELLALDDAISHLAEEDDTAAQLTQLRIFAGLSVEEAGQALGMSRATAYRNWTYAKASLRARIRGNVEPSSS